VDQITALRPSGALLALADPFLRLTARDRSVRYSANSSFLALARAFRSSGATCGGGRSISSMALTTMPPTSARRVYLWSAGTTYHGAQAVDVAVSASSYAVL